MQNKYIEAKKSSFYRQVKKTNRYTPIAIIAERQNVTNFFLVGSQKMKIFKTGISAAQNIFYSRLHNVISKWLKSLKRNKIKGECVRKLKSISKIVTARLI